MYKIRARDSDTSRDKSPELQKPVWASFHLTISLTWYYDTEADTSGNRRQGDKRDCSLGTENTGTAESVESRHKEMERMGRV